MGGSVMLKRVIAGMCTCSLIGTSGGAIAPSASWRTVSGNSYCDLQGYDFRLFGSYPGQSNPPDAILELASKETGDSTLGLQWEGPGEPRIISAGLTVDEVVDGAVRILVSVDGAAIPSVRTDPGDSEDFDFEWAPSDKAKWLSVLKTAREVKAVFVNAGGRQIGSRSFNLTAARQLSQELPRVGWRCP